MVIRKYVNSDTFPTTPSLSFILIDLHLPLPSASLQKKTLSKENIWGKTHQLSFKTSSINYRQAPCKWDSPHQLHSMNITTLFLSCTTLELHILSFQTSSRFDHFSTPTTHQKMQSIRKSANKLPRNALSHFLHRWPLSWNITIGRTISVFSEDCVGSDFLSWSMAGTQGRSPSAHTWCILDGYYSTRRDGAPSSAMACGEKWWQVSWMKLIWAHRIIIVLSRCFIMYNNSY